MFDTDRYLKRVKSVQEKNDCELVLRPHQQTMQTVFNYIRRYSAINAHGFVNIKDLFSFFENNTVAKNNTQQPALR
jgi:hypothetical protein